MAVRLLSFHVPYRCRHAGACCTAGWPIPVEADVHGALTRAVSAGSLVAPTGRAPVRRLGELLDDSADGPDDVVALMRIEPDGACACYERSIARCTIHRQLGPAYLPSACRHFPRVVLHDSRGCHVTLSHFCPTAAAMLDQPAAVSIVEDPDGWDASLEGLDARAALPPLVRPDLLADLDGWDELERRSVSLLVEEDVPLDESLARLMRIVEDVREWSPEEESLRARVTRAFADRRHFSRDQSSVHEPALARLDEIVRTSVVCGEPEPRPVASRRHVPLASLDSPGLGRPVRRFLAAHAFASWIAYQGRGIRTWARGVLAAVAVLVVEAARRSDAESRPLDLALLFDAVRESDRLLRHLVSPEALAVHLSLMEGHSLLSNTDSLQE